MDHPLEELPVLTKATLMEHFDDLVTNREVRLDQVEGHLATFSGDEQFLGRYRVCATSRTSGRRGLFLIRRESVREPPTPTRLTALWTPSRPAGGRSTRAPKNLGTAERSAH